jgi:cytochrome c-type biogenesis protein CcmH/NrfG
MAVLTVSLDQALACHRSGDLRRAEQLYRQLLQGEPADADAWHLLGDALRVQGKLAEAVAAYRQALRLRPDAAEAHYGLGLCLTG